MIVVFDEGTAGDIGIHAAAADFYGSLEEAIAHFENVLVEYEGTLY